MLRGLPKLPQRVSSRAQSGSLGSLSRFLLNHPPPRLETGERLQLCGVGQECGSAGTVLAWPPPALHSPRVTDVPL